MQLWLEHYVGEYINKSAMMVGVLCGGNESYGVQGRLAHYVGEGNNKSTMIVGVLCEGRSHL